MRRRPSWSVAFLAVVLVFLARPAYAEQRKGDPKDEEAIQRKAEGFIEAFNKGDAKALAGFWTPDGDYTDQSGRNLKGRAAIEKAFQGFFGAQKGLKLAVDSVSLRFATPDVAIEDGTTAVIPPDGGPPSRARYTIVHVKKDGHWYLESVRDAPFTPPTNYEHLRGLQWAVGDWANNADAGESERLSVTWAENQNFVVASFTTTFKTAAVGSATHWIGWDPLARRIRSWIFDATGGFGEGSWTQTQDGKKWAIKTTSVLRDGRKAAATYIVTSVDDDTVTLQSKDRMMDGNAIPDGKEVKLKRVK